MGTYTYYEKCGCFNVSDKIYRENQKVFLNFVREIKNNNPKLLDLGCGDGGFTLKIAETIGSSRIYGIEINERAAENAMKKGMLVKVSDLNYRFPYPSNFFDIVSANQVLEHLWNTDNFFREVNRVLKKEDMLLFPR
jgi:ubiquinone/menaquinone biosynthesis C-methylase UbiE